MGSARIVQNAAMTIVFVLLCVVGMEYLAINIGQGKPVVHGYRVQAAFADADGIPTAADVRVAGIVVGKVVEIAHDPHHPGQTVATMEISVDNADPVYTNGFAKVRPKTLLGEKYVDLTVGSRQGEAIPDMGMLPEARTTKDVSNDEIFNAFDAKTREQQKQVIAALDQATAARAGDVQAILPQLDTVLRNLDPVARAYTNSDENVRNIFQNLDTVLATLADENAQLAGLLRNGNIAIGAIAQRDDSLVRTLQGASNVTAELNTAFAPTVDAQRQALSKLTPAFQNVDSLVSLILDPQAGCNNQPCHIDEVFTGTLLGQINYPSDQLTVTSNVSPATPHAGFGEPVTNEWDSMFSFPQDGYHSQNATHSALNIVLSEHCDTIQQSVLQTVPTGQVSGALKQLVQQACGVVFGQKTQSTTAGPSGATDVALATGAQQ